MQDKDIDIIIIKSERHHMARERSCRKTIKLKASQWTEIHEMLIFQREELTTSEHTLFHNLPRVLYGTVRLVSAPGLLGVYSTLQE